MATEKGRQLFRPVPATLPASVEDSAFAFSLLLATQSLPPRGCGPGTTCDRQDPTTARQVRRLFQVMLELSRDSLANCQEVYSLYNLCGEQNPAETRQGALDTPTILRSTWLLPRASKRGSVTLGKTVEGKAVSASRSFRNPARRTHAARSTSIGA